MWVRRAQCGENCSVFVPPVNHCPVSVIVGVLRSARILESDEVARGGIGAMTDARWKAFYEEMAAVGALPAGLDPSKAYTTQFVNKRTVMV